jgi:HD-GYP domain-containing protein (c-di-GMP phosphodiesterase class II)
MNKNTNGQLLAEAEAQLSRALRTAIGAQLAHAPETAAPQHPAEELLHELSVHQIELEMQNEALRQAQIALEESRDSYTDLYEFAPVGYLTLTDTGMIAKMNLTAATLLGVERNKLLRHRFDPFVAREDSERWQRYFAGALRRDERQGCELTLKRGDAPAVHSASVPDRRQGCELALNRGDVATFYAQLNCLRVEAGGGSPTVRITLTDITGRKQAEAALQRANRALAALSAVNGHLVRADSEDGLLQMVCQAIIEHGGYQLAFVGYAQQDENKSVKIMAYASADQAAPDPRLRPTWAAIVPDVWPGGRAIRSGATQVCQDIANDPLPLPWRDTALQRGYLSSIALPLNGGNGKAFGFIMVFAKGVNEFTDSEIGLLEEMAGDLAFGVRTLHTRHERDLALEQNQRHLAQLQDNLESTIRAIASIVELRDPYTSGHQARVAILAVAIARQMELTEDQVHSIRLAGVVHDLGKIQIPAEILSKPGKISDTQRNLVKVHAQAGHDILKGINFPWPIAQMVLQHHERLDGSGYPQGLRGDAILLEARILSVADVVEAMSSHRPYRTGLAMADALAEIERGSGQHYDPAAVAACLKVVRDNGMKLPE